MPHRRRYSISSLCFKQPELGSDDLPAPSNARFSTRMRKLLKTVSPLVVPVASPKPPKPQRVREKREKVSEATIRLAKLESLPPLSPEGSQFAADVHQGKFKYADVAGEYLLQLLQDNLPGYEKYAGEVEARNNRHIIGVLCSGDEEKIRKMVTKGPVFEMIDKWSTEEKSKVCKYPTTICTSGATAVRATAQRVSVRRGSKSSPPSGVRMTTQDWPGSLETPEHMAYSSDSGGTSPDSLAPSDTSEYEDAMESSSMRESLSKGVPWPDEQMSSEHWPHTPVEWPTANSQSSEYYSDEDDLTLEAKQLRKLFPHQRYRQD